jgi:asparagine synthase (glutamine-hydrolysing)
MAGALPPRTIRRRKHAFQIPLEPWLAGPLSGFVREILLDQRARARGWFDMKGVERLIGAGNGVARAASRSAEPRLQSGDPQSVWTLLCLELWAREFLD